MVNGSTTNTTFIEKVSWGETYEEVCCYFVAILVCHSLAKP